MRGVSTAFWSVVLLGATVSIGAGFAGGRTIVAAGALPAPRPQIDPQLPAPIRQRILRRSLIGAHSLDAAEGSDPYSDPDVGVFEPAARASSFDPRRERAKIAVIVVDAGRAGSGLDAFVSSPLPLAMVVAPGDDDARATCETISAAGKLVVIDGSQAKPALVASFARGPGRGVIASLDAARAAALVHSLDRTAFVVDANLAEDDVVSRVARAAHRRVFARDVIADARDDGPYVDFMLRDALAIAERSGQAVIAIHARTESFDALVRFADRAQRDGADIVPLTDLTGT